MVRFRFQRIRKLSALITGVILVTSVSAQTTQINWVFFKNKGPISLQKPIRLSPVAERRLALRGQDDSWLEIPVYEPYVDQVELSGATIRQRSRWFNAISIYTEADQELNQISQLECVLKIKPVAISSPIVSTPMTPVFGKMTNLDYGESLTQNEMLGLNSLHSAGWTGENVLIGVFDTGFNLNHPVFSQIDVIAGYDFVAHEANLDGTDSGHGTACTGLIGGYLPGEFIGAAYGARFLLARTEDAASESHAEEDNWVAALEWADALGVDVISSSLAYKEFDNSSENYPTSALDGNTTVITLATNLAATRGILVVNAMGNEGPGISSLWAPADGAHVLSVGGVDRSQHVVSSSGQGPTADGRIKPDVVTLGTTVYLPSQSGGYYFGTGTSYATPMIAGSAALVLQVSPTLAPDSIIALFRSAGNRSNAPDNAFGWGVPNVGAIINKLTQQLESNEQSYIWPNPVTATSLTIVLNKNKAPLAQSYRIINLRGQVVVEGKPEAVSVNEIRLSNLPQMASGLYFLTMNISTETFTAKFIYLP
ncbi:MAG: hypothetical protein AUJ47_03930 [Candidatus Marinimicrobia bacterium CG1_02_48_14]|nr:MAG: hypothetical protein AUJ47_03930 [Candidatus Marinimicrobia bacterium CG1_02_48_14]